MPVSCRNSAEKSANRLTLSARSLSAGVTARAGLPGGMMPAPAQLASRPSSCRSITSTRLPSLARKYAAVRPMIPPPMTVTSGCAAMRVL